MAYICGCSECRRMRERNSAAKEFGTYPSAAEDRFITLTTITNEKKEEISMFEVKVFTKKKEELNDTSKIIMEKTYMADSTQKAAAMAARDLPREWDLDDVTIFVRPFQPTLQA